MKKNSNTLEWKCIIVENEQYNTRKEHEIKKLNGRSKLDD